MTIDLGCAPRETTPDPRPARRIVDRKALPLDDRPLVGGYCPVCKRGGVKLTRHHVVPKGASGGDDVPQNLIWLCGDGSRGCHGVLTHRGRDGGTGLSFHETALRFHLYLPLTVREYAESKRYPGWLEDYYCVEEAA